MLYYKLPQCVTHPLNPPPVRGTWSLCDNIPTISSPKLGEVPVRAVGSVVLAIIFLPTKKMAFNVIQRATGAIVIRCHSMSFHPTKIGTKKGEKNLSYLLASLTLPRVRRPSYRRRSIAVLDKVYEFHH